jgi:hypothetical protein
MKAAVTGNPPVAKAFDNPAALLFATERKAKGGKQEIRVVINHPEILLEEYHGIPGGSSEKDKKETLPAGCNLMDDLLRIVERFEQ